MKLRNCILALGAGSTLGGAAIAQVPVEVEGEFQSYNHSERTMTVMSMPVIVNGQTFMHSPTTDRRAIGYGINKWFKSDRLPGQRRRGFLGGTAIVIGNWDDTLQAIVADDVFTEPAENVILGVVTDNLCTAPNCDGEDNFIQGSQGPVLAPLTDIRIAAGDLVDEGGFLVDVTDEDLVGVAFAAEGYYTDDEVIVPDTSGAPGDTRTISGVHNYFHLELAGFNGQLLANPDDREISALRVTCEPGGRLEIRGNLHARVDAETGAIDDPLGTVTTGIVQAQYDLGAPLGATSGIDAVDVNSPFGEYRVRTDLPVCPTTLDVRWQNVPGLLPNENIVVYAELNDVPVEVAAP